MKYLVMIATTNEEGSLDGYNVKVFEQQWDLNSWLKNEASNNGVKRILTLANSEELERLFRQRTAANWLKEGDSFIFYFENERVKPLEVTWETE